MDSLIHDLRDITIRRISVSAMDNNVYLLTAKSSGEQVLIDAADDAPAIRQLLRRASFYGITLTLVLALIGGVLLAVSAERRLAEINRTTVNALRTWRRR